MPHFLRAARRQAWLVAVAVAAVVGSAGLLLVLQQPVYRASMKIVVGQAGGVFQPDAGGSVDSFTHTMTNLLQSQVVAERVIARSGVETTPGALLRRLGVSSEPQSSVLVVTYDSTDRREAATVLDNVGRVFADIVGERLGRTERGSAPVTATVFDPAHVDADPVSPRPARALAVALLLGLLVGAGLVAAREALKRRIYGVGEAQDAFDAQVLGTLPQQLRGGRTPYLRGRGANGAGPTAALDVLGANVRFGPIGRTARIVVVTSARPGEGRSTVAANLAVALGLSDEVICVDADGRTPGLGAYLGVRAPDVGLTDILVGRAALSDALLDVRHSVVGNPARESKELRAPWTAPAPIAPPRHGIGCRLLAHGASEHGFAPAAGPDATGRLMAALRHAARYAIIDAPPLLDGAGAFGLASSADAVIVVARDGVTTLADATAVASILDRLSEKPYGVVLTDSSESVPELWKIAPGSWTGSG